VLLRPAGNGLVGRKLGTPIDPAPENIDFVGDERFALGRHPLVFVRGKDALEEQALLRFARDKRRARLAAFDNERAGVQAKTRLLFDLAMAGYTPLLEERFDVPLVVYRGLTPGRSREQEWQQQPMEKRRHKPDTPPRRTTYFTTFRMRLL